jgi:hypothetical protein
MENIQSTLQKIIGNTTAVAKGGVKNILVLYEEKIFNIGDCCVRFDKLKYFRAFFNNAAISMNFKKENAKFADGLLKNNPHLASVSMLDWDEIAFNDYDIVIAVMYNEENILKFIHDKYGAAIRDGRFPLAIYSMSQLILQPSDSGKYIFPLNRPLIEMARTPDPGELYVSEEEQQWANSWLQSKGMKEGEDLLILLDSTLRKDKLLNPLVYFEFVGELLKRENTRVLVFDEAGVGKEEFYRAWLGDQYMGKLIVSRQLTLRQDICLLASTYTRMVFGPCTGLLHCASAIYNNYVSKGMPVAQVPLLAVYTGQYKGLELNAFTWWGRAPLVSCLMLKQRPGGKQLELLHQLPQNEKMLNNSLPCSEYTSAMLTGFVNSKIKPRKQSVAYDMSLN